MSRNEGGTGRVAHEVDKLDMNPITQLHGTIDEKLMHTRGS